MDGQIIKDRIVQLLNEIVDRAKIINQSEDNELQLDIDLVMEDIRLLYREYNFLRKISEEFTDAGKETQKHAPHAVNEIAGEEPVRASIIIPEAHIEPNPEPEPEPELELEPEPESEPATVVEYQTEPEPSPEPEQESEPETEPAPDVEYRTELEPEPAPEPEPEVEYQPAPEAEPEPEPEYRPAPESEPEYRPEPEPEPAPETEPVPEPEPTPEPEPVKAAASIPKPQPVQRKGSLKSVLDLFSQGHSRAIGEQFEEDNSLHQRISRQKEDKSIGARLQQGPVSNIKEAIGLNEKFLFINELFNGDIQAYNEALMELNSFSSQAEAFEHLNLLTVRYAWDKGQTTATVEKLAGFVQRRYMTA